MTAPADEYRVQTLAYQIWELEGRPEGRDQEHWRQAEQQLEVEFRMGYPDATGHGWLRIPRVFPSTEQRDR